MVNPEKLKKNIILIDGEEIFLIDQTVQKILRYYISEDFEQFNLDRIHGIDFERIYNACETLPFMNDKKIILVEDIDLSKTLSASVKSELEKMIEYLPQIAETSILLFVFRGKKAYRSKFVKHIEKLGDHISFHKLTAPALREFISQRLTNVHYQREFLDYFIDRSYYLDKNHDKNLYDIVNALDQLKGNAKNNILKLSDIDNLAGNYEKNIFKLMDSFSQRDIPLSLQYLYDLNREKDESYRIFFMLVRQIRNLLYVKEFNRRKYPVESATEISGISKYEFQKISKFIRFWSYKDLMRNLHLAYKVEVILKSTSQDTRQTVENFLIQSLLKS